MVRSELGLPGAAYRMSTAQVYAAATRYVFEQDTLDMLGFCEVRHEGNSLRAGASVCVVDLPTWAIDFAHPWPETEDHTLHNNGFAPSPFDASAGFRYFPKQIMTWNLFGSKEGVQLETERDRQYASRIDTAHPTIGAEADSKASLDRETGNTTNHLDNVEDIEIPRNQADAPLYLSQTTHSAARTRRRRGNI
ncbi:hypothetical protein BU23DRAFT_565121 [Bimuria novae-zelandiae CBS 107.79]|uniref:Uncharacterized protein n=1 Tax=Bimuria novae-zelandiae CBS 107.79 TaxID=1447943 RepID=A0A6A5VK51_9PLEO|nr:hypothetical protein BU23DRAFT_565121 [Bimuria novae-zelandiae CBS 107.79]